LKELVNGAKMYTENNCRTRLAEEYGLELKFKQNFHEFYKSASQEEDHNELLKRMKVVGGQEPDMSAEEWEAAGIYLGFAFQKRR
jgi:mRNA (guanine-N7-)-methyltransferase